MQETVRPHVSILLQPQEYQKLSQAFIGRENGGDALHGRDCLRKRGVGGSVVPYLYEEALGYAA